MSILPPGDQEFDVAVPVLVIGAGACGLAAALSAKEHGAEVMVLERDESRRRAALRFPGA